MNDLENLISKENWILALKPYQLTSVNELTSRGINLEDIALTFLSKTGSDSTAPFGSGGDSPNNYFGAVKEEMTKFICGDEKYAEVRADISGNWNKGKTYAAMAIAAAISPYVGIVATVLLPVTTIVLSLIVSVGINAWCNTKISIS